MADEPRPTINPMENGPYLVKNLENLSSQKGKIDTKPTLALCRCGGSANKPFCDGTHAGNGFSSAKEEGRLEDKVDTYAGSGITVHDNRSICAHAGYCTDKLAAVFRQGQEPWVDPDGASRDEIVAAIKNCPSGAISYAIPGEQITVADQDAGIFIAPNGPYVVSGAPELVATQLAQGASAGQITLCRCGGSKNKPFCDGSHWYNGFADEDN